MGTPKLTRIVLFSFGVIVVLIALLLSFLVYQFRAIELDKARKQTEPARLARIRALNGQTEEPLLTPTETPPTNEN